MNWGRSQFSLAIRVSIWPFGFREVVLPCTVGGPDRLPETVYAENRHQYDYNYEADVPRAEKPDF
jgi:hypothetical protein